MVNNKKHASYLYGEHVTCNFTVRWALFWVHTKKEWKTNILPDMHADPLQKCLLFVSLLVKISTHESWSILFMNKLASFLS